nr:hypothetical protein [Tanacetum cinerariifolium]
MAPKKAAPKRTTRLNPACDANRTGDESHTSGTGVRRTERVTQECTYQDFMKCQPLYFKGTEGVVELTQIVGNDAAYVMTWIELNKKMVDKYCPRNEMKKIETEFWNLEVQGTDVTSNTPLTHIPLRTILGVLEIGIRAEAIENQVKNVLLDYNHFENIALVKKGLHETFMHMLVAALVGVDGPPVMPEDSYAYVVAAFQALPPPNNVPGPEEPEQAPPSPVYIPYVPESVYPEYIPSKDDVFPAEEQPLPSATSPTAESPGYIPESDPDEDSEEDDDEDPVDYPADHDYEEEEEEPSGDDADEEDKEQDEDDDNEEEEHPALADSILPPPTVRVMARISFRPQPPTLSFTKEDAERFLVMPILPPSPLTSLSSLLPQIPSPPLPASPLILPKPLPAASQPLQLLSSDRRADRPEVTLPPPKRLSIVHCPGYEAEESSVAAATRPIEGRRADYGFVDYVEAEIRRQRIEDIGYGIRDTWIDLRDVAEEEALTTLEGVNTRVTELAAMQEQDTQDIYEVMEDT